MRFSSLLTLAISLAMDSTAVGASRGLAARDVRARDFAVVAGFFGGAQALALCLGSWFGARIEPFVDHWAPWFISLLLAGTGLTAIWQAGRARDHRPHHSGTDLFGLRVVLVLAIATSMDALAVGITLPMLHVPLAVAVLTIGLTTAALSAAGLAIGRRAGAKLGPRMTTFGGILLVLVGAQILVPHLAGWRW
jgi:putative Mn2+ efflux pump MntP